MVVQQRSTELRVDSAPQLVLFTAKRLGPLAFWRQNRTHASQNDLESESHATSPPLES